MRLDEWQKYIDSEFVADGKIKPEKANDPFPDPELQSPIPKDTRTETPDNEMAAEVREDIVPRPDSEVVSDTASDELRIARMAAVNPDIASVIPSFDRYLPTGHPAHSAVSEPDEQADMRVPDVTPIISEEQGLVVPRQDSLLTTDTEDPAVSNLRSSEVLPARVPVRRDLPLPVQGDHLIASLAALGRLYASVSQSAADAPEVNHRSKQELLERLMNPILSMEETAQLLDVSPTTVRRYTNRGLLPCFRQGEEDANIRRLAGRKSLHRRFRLSDILSFLETRQI